MGSAPAFQFYADDYLVGTMTMTLAEKGAYMDCLSYQWSVGSIPGDDLKALARVMRCTPAEAKKVWPVVSGKFVRDEGGWKNLRLEHERDKQAAYRESRIESGRRGGLAKSKLTSSTPTISPVAKPLANPSSSSSSVDCSPSVKNTEDRAAFERWWLSYPRKVGKGAAFKAWARIRPDSTRAAEFGAAVERQSRSPQWRKEGGQFIPHPSTWLNEERWNDAVDLVEITVDPFTRAEQERHRFAVNQQMQAAIDRQKGKAS